MMPVYIQVNTSNEPSKFGVSPEEALPLIRAVASLDRLRIRGLMTIGLLSAEEQRVRPCFRRLYQLQQEAEGLNLPNASFATLSKNYASAILSIIHVNLTLVS